MAAIDEIVNVNISQSTKAVAQASFSVPLIVGPTSTSWAGTDYVHSYTDPAGMLTDGFTTGSPEYVYALTMFAQPLTPTVFFVGHRTTAVAQIDTITPTAVNTTHYIVTINGVAYDYLSDSSATAAEIVAGLLALVNADPAAPCTATGSTTLILTANVPGIGFTTAVNANQALVHTTPNNGIANDMANIQLKDDSWYGIAACQFTDADILQLDSWVSAQKKIYVAVSSTSAIATTSTTDVGAVLKSRSTVRTALMFTAAPTQGKDTAWLGGQLPSTPGSNNWAFKTLVECTVDELTSTQQTILIGDPVAGVAGKNVNIYQTVGGVNITQMGLMGGGQPIDITVGIDWLESQIQTNIYSLLVNNPKIPYTDSGVATLIQAVRSAILLGVVNGLAVDGQSAISVTAPLVLSVPANQRANRIAPTITFTCRLAGAFNAVVVNGTVSV